MVQLFRSLLMCDSQSVLIVGGGLAGLAAAVELGRHGVSVTLLESRDRLGGRASSFTDPESGETLDNCQHVSMGCCTALQRFCETVGVAGKFRVEKELTFVDPEGRCSKLRGAALPAPLHLAPSFARLQYLSWREKLRLAIGLRALARKTPRAIDDREPFLDWLRRHRQTDRIIERFWEVVLVSALSESLDRVDVSLARKVLVDGFLRNRDGWEVHLPTAPLDLLYGAPVIDWLTSHGGQVCLQAGVRRLEGGAAGIVGIELRSGERKRAEDYILAVPHYRVLDLLPTEVASHPRLAGIAKIESAPITSLHLWLDREIMELPHAVLIGRASQWIFQRPEQGAAGTENPRGAYYQVVISASRALRGRSQEEVCGQVMAELGAIWPAAREARLLHWRMVTERRAVFSGTPGVDALRPVQQSPVANLQLAGDWTATGWPSTMEGAVRSGMLAAENVLRRRGQDVRLLPPDLPTAGLSRLLLGLRQ